MGTRARDFSRNIGVGGNAGGNISIADVLPYLTTANVIELGNLYYSNDRVFSNTLLASINDLFDVDTENYTANVGFGLVWTGNLWIPGPVTANLATITTDDVVEGSNNLYYTNTRVRSAIGALNPTIIYDELTGKFAANIEAVAFSANTTDSIPEGFVNKYFSNDRVYANLQLAYLSTLFDVDYDPETVSSNSVLVFNVDTGNWEPEEITTLSVKVANSLSNTQNFTSDDVREGNINLYLTQERFNLLLANSSIDALVDVDTTSGNLEIGYILSWDGSNWVPVEANLDAFTGASNFSEFSNLANVALFAENSNTANSTLFAENSNIANIAIFASLADFANVSLFAEIANSVSSSFVVERANIANTVLSLSNFDTDDILEGSNNLYYTDDKVLANVQNMSIDVLADVQSPTKSAGDVLMWNGSVWAANSRLSGILQNNFVERANVANTVLSIDNFTTDNLDEGFTNFYYTADRANADIVNILSDKSLSLKNLALNGNIEVTGNLAYFDVDTYEIYSDVLSIYPKSAIDGAGIYLGAANVFLTYNEPKDSLNITKGLVVGGNIIPSVTGIFNLGSPEFKFRSAFFGATTVYLGNLRLSEGPDGSLQIYNDLTGAASPVQLSNVNAEEYVVVNRLNSAGGIIDSYIGGNTLQYTTGTIGNLYLGIKTDNEITKFTGIRVERSTYSGANVDTDVIIYTKREGVDNESVKRAEFNADGNIVLTGNLVVNGLGLIPIARSSLTANTAIINAYSNTDSAVSYDNESGIITVTKDGVYEATSILTLSDDWQDTPIKAQYIPTGTYIVQIIANDSAQGGGHVQEYYSGVMSWYSSDTNSGTADEIALHRAGAGPGNGTIFLRVQRTLTASADDLKLQIAGTTTNTGTSSYNFKFRRLL